MQDSIILFGAAIMLTSGICCLWWPEQLQRIKGSKQPPWLTIQLRVFGCLLIAGSGIVFFITLRMLPG